MKRLKRILVFALAQLGLISLHAQQPAPSGAQPVAPDSGGTGAKSPVSPAATSAAALLATNVPPRPMSYDEERTARDLLRAAKIQNAERRVPRDAFDNTFTIVPETDNKTFKLVPGNLKPAQTPIAGTPAAPVVRPPAVVQQPVLSPNATAPVSDPGPAWQPDPYEQELVSKARLHQNEPASEEARRPVEAVAPSATVVLQPTPSPAPAPAPAVAPAVAPSPTIASEIPDAFSGSDPYVLELTGKARARQAEISASEASRAAEPTTVVATPPPVEPPVAPPTQVVLPPTSSQREREIVSKKADEEFRRKELERIEAEVNKAAEERRRREAALSAPAPAPVTVAPTPAPVVVVVAPVVPTAPPAAEPAPQPVTVVSAPEPSLSSGIPSMSSEIEAQVRALLRQTSHELQAAPTALALPPGAPEIPANPPASFVPPSTPKLVPAAATPETERVDSATQKQIERELQAQRAAELRASREAEARAKEEARQRALAEATRIKEEKARINEAAVADARRVREEKRLAAIEQEQIAKQRGLEARQAQVRAQQEKEATEREARLRAAIPKQDPIPTAAAVPAAIATPSGGAPVIPPAFASRMLSSDEARARAMLDQKLLETGDLPPSAAATTVLPAPATVTPTPASSLVTTSLPAEDQLKAEAAARREREKVEAEVARQRVRDEQLRIESEAPASRTTVRSQADAEKKAKALADKQAKEEARLAAAAEAKARQEAKMRDKEARRTKVASVRSPEVEPPQTKSSEPVVRSWEVSGGKTKEQRLADLYDAYGRDQISPSEYHRARAKIMSEP